MSHRTLKLTHAEIANIQTALGIAEKKYTDLYKSAVELATVRGNDEKTNQIEAAKYMHELACKFADLNINIQNSEKDV